MVPPHVTFEEWQRAIGYLVERSYIDGECYVWKLRTDGPEELLGYGKMEWQGKDWRVHRFAYHYLVAYLPKSTLVHHKCSNKACWRPEHLQAVSHQDNAAEMLGRVYYQEEIQYLREEIERLKKDLEETEKALDYVFENHCGCL